jgi:tRNA threonylcarbamoyladenosine biosynthesis protein TsaE
MLNSLDELTAFAEAVYKLIEGREKRNRAYLVHLVGDLGSGKTTFTQTLARLFGIHDQVISPTFILKKSYKVLDGTFHTLIHVDAYRFTTPKESSVLRMEEDIVNPHNLILIEWPEHMYTEEPDMTISFTHKGETNRMAHIVYEA